MPHTLNPTSNCPLRLSCALRFATYALSCPLSLYVLRPTFRSITHGLRNPAVTSSSLRNTARCPLDAASLAAAAVGSSPATETTVDGSTTRTPWNSGTKGAMPAREVDVLGGAPALPPFPSRCSSFREQASSSSSSSPDRRFRTDDCAALISTSTSASSDSAHSHINRGFTPSHQNVPLSFAGSMTRLVTSSRSHSAASSRFIDPPAPNRGAPRGLSCRGIFRAV
mmetsp:Transcript_11215/g.46774  ORF Transcript_11215/g.46774 Transcript_11215/m.46774 type:complete len:225 (-) Transcript_11215:1831-2505(-)